MPTPSVSVLPSEIELQRRSIQRRRWAYLIGGLITSFCLGVAFVAFGLNSPLLPLILMAMLAMPFIIWHKPIAGIYLILACVCLIELQPRGMPGVISDRIPFFWNINTIIQRYAKAGFESMPFSPMELVIAQIVGLSAVRGIFDRTLRFQFGPLGVFFGVYLLFVLVAWINGLAHGGDFKISLQEVRSQAYLAIAYLLAVNFVKERHLSPLLWITGVSIGLKGIDYTWRRYTIFSGMAIPDQGVGSHEEAFFFVCFLLLLGILFICRSHPRLRTLMTIGLPLVVLGNVATNRRAGSAALLFCVPLFLLLVYRLFPRHRRTVVIGTVIAVLLWFPYYQIFKNKSGIVATLARSVHSKQEPNARDLASNAYRDAEDYNLFYTVQQSPVIGYGYGRPFLIVAPMADISEIYEFWNILPHDQVLWVWMRVGTLGFLSFWILYAAMLIFSIRVAIQQKGGGRIAGMFASMSAGALTIFGLYDLQFSSPRDMLFVGFWVGVASTYYKPVRESGWEWKEFVKAPQRLGKRHEEYQESAASDQKEQHWKSNVL